MSPLLLFTLGATAGALLGVQGSLAAIVTAALVLMALRLPLSLRAPVRGALALALGLLWSSVWVSPEPRLASPDGVVSVGGEVERTWRDHRGRWRARLEGVSINGQPVPGELSVGPLGPEGAELRAGDTLEAVAWVRETGRRTNPGVAPPWAPRRWRWTGRVRGELSLVIHPRGGASWDLEQAVTLPGQEMTALYRALLLGDRSLLEPSLRDAFADAGVAHLLAISGLHLAVFGLGLFGFLRFALSLCPPLARRMSISSIAGLLAVVGTWTYVGAIHPSQATLRAAAALTLVLVGLLVSRRAPPLHTVVVAAAAVTALDPLSPLGASFQLSFAAATALALLAPALKAVNRFFQDRDESPWVQRLGIWLVGSMMVCVATGLVTAPLAWSWFGQWAPLGILINLVAVPLVALAVVPCAYLWFLARLLWPALGELITPAPTLLGGLLLDFVEGWAEVAGPATVAMAPHGVGLLLALCVLLALGRKWKLSALGVALAALGLGLSGPRADHLSVEAFDVGHGDAILLQLPQGKNVLVDTGGSPRPFVRSPSPDWSRTLARRDLLPALQRRGVGALDLLVLTHGDADHVRAGVALAQRLPIRHLWLPPCDAETPAVRDIARAVLAGGGRVSSPAAGETFTLSGAELSILWPPPTEEGCSMGSNNGSRVLSVRAGSRRVLLVGDIEGEAEQALLSRAPRDLAAQVLKVAHHGSRTSSASAFLDAVAPRHALVSGSLFRRHGPPHLEVLERLADHGAQVHLTGRDGSVRLELHPDPDRDP